MILKLHPAAKFLRFCALQIVLNRVHQEYYAEAVKQVLLFRCPLTIWHAEEPK